MALYPDPLVALINSVNALNDVQLTSDQYTFSPPETFSAADGINNSRITISAKDINSPLDGSITLTYKRLDLADIPKLVTPRVAANLPTTTLHVAEALNRTFGFNFSAADIVKETLTTLTDGVGIVTLTALPASVGWIGSVDVQVVKGNMPITDYLKTTRLPGLNYPAAVTNKPFAAMYSYWRDFSARQLELKQVVTGNNSMGTLQSILKAVTGDDWVLTGNSRYSLDGAMVVSNDTPANNATLNPKYARGVVIRLTDQCQGLAGDLILHYNVAN